MPGVKMRNFSKFLWVYLCTLCFALVTACSLTSCHQPKSGGLIPFVDSAYVAQTTDAIVNPSFSLVSEVLDFRSKLVEEYETDQLLRSLPESVLINVATVCLKKYTTVTKKEIAAEYRANQSVYDNLDKESTQENTSQGDSPTAVVEGQPVSAPLSTSYHYEVDTVNGRPTKVLIKEEKYESK